MRKHTATATYALGVACFGAIGLFRTWSGLDAYGASLVRGLWGALTLTLVALLVKPQVFRANVTYIARCLVWGGILGAAIFVYFLTMDHSNQSVGALFLFLQVVWYPLYTKVLLPDETRRTRWPIYIVANVFTVAGVVMALGFFRRGSVVHLESIAIALGVLLSFLAFLYFVVGRWLFFAEQKRERQLMQTLLGRLHLHQLYDRLLKDEVSASHELQPFWISFQRTLFQSYGMVLICLAYIPYDAAFFERLVAGKALLNGAALGMLCLAVAFVLITYADTATISGRSDTSGKLSTKIKGVSQQIELVLALLLGYVVLHENIGTDGLIGCSILVASYVTGVLYADKDDPRGVPG